MLINILNIALTESIRQALGKHNANAEPSVLYPLASQLEIDAFGLVESVQFIAQKKLIKSGKSIGKNKAFLA